MMESYYIQSYAKLNVTLDILGKQASGYHEVSTIMQTLDLHDTICLTKLPQDDVELVCSWPELNNTNNLAFKAVQLVRQHLSLKQGIRIEIQKRIPLASGLGGGSSNAAAVMIALKQWLRLSLSQEDLFSLAASLGSDVSFLLSGGLALGQGRGERITSLPANWPASMRWIVLVKPSLAVSSADVYHNLPASDYTNGSHSRAVLTAFEKKEIPQWTDFHNGLERSVLERYPEVQRAKEDILKENVPIVWLSGSGPTLVVPFGDLEKAAALAEVLSSTGYEVHITRPVNQEADIMYF